MGRKTTAVWLHAAVLAGAWLSAAGVVQSAAGSEIGGSVQQLGERLERHLRTKGEKSTPMQTAPRPRERAPEETFQPWERVVT